MYENNRDIIVKCNDENFYQRIREYINGDEDKFNAIEVFMKPKYKEDDNKKELLKILKWPMMMKKF